MSLAGKGKASPPWWQDRIEHDPQAMPPLEWSAEPRAEGSEDSESVESERRRNPWGVDSDDLVTRFELYGYWEGSEESEGPEPEESEGPEPNTGVPSWFWEHQSRTLEFPLCSSGMESTQMNSPLTVRWDSSWTVTILNLILKIHGTPK